MPTCNMSDSCTSPVTHIGDKGYVYCTAHAADRRTWERTRKMRRWELDLITAGKPVPSYRYQGKPAAAPINIALAAIERITDTDELVRMEHALTLKLKNAAYPQLRVKVVIDDSEVFDALRCPVCGNLVEPDDLVAVDTSVRWTTADADAFDFDRGRAAFTFDGDSDYGPTDYYLHGDKDMHRVRLPEGWQENAL